MDKNIYVHVVMKDNKPIAVSYNLDTALQYAKVNLATVVSDVKVEGVVKDLVTPTLAISIDPPF